MAYIQTRIDSKGRKRHRAQIKLKGHQCISGTFDRKTDAKKWAQQTESSIRDGRYFKTIEARRHTVKEMIDRYQESILPGKGSHRLNQEIQLNWWKSQIGHYTLADASPQLISEYRDKLLKDISPRIKRPLTPAAVNRYLAALSHCFTIAVNEWEWLEDSPMRKVRKPKESRGRIRFLSDEERNRLLKACKDSSNPYLYKIVVLALSTGARRGEILSLRYNQVDIKRGMITLYETKNNEVRSIPLTGHAYDLIKDHIKVRHIQTDLLFPGKNKKQPIDIRLPWEEALKKAEIENFRFHDLRHTAASYLAMSGATLAEIAEVLGHKTLQMVKRYSHLTESHTARVVGKMNEEIFYQSDKAY